MIKIVDSMHLDEVFEIITFECDRCVDKVDVDTVRTSLLSRVVWLLWWALLPFNHFKELLKEELKRFRVLV